MSASRACFNTWLWLALSVSLSASAGTNEAIAPDHGCRYTNEVVEDMPWSIHIIQIERGRRDLELCTALGKGEVIGMGTVSDQVKSLPRARGQALAAINGDFYEKKEKVTSPAGHDCFWMAPDGTPHMTNVYSRFRVVWANGTTNQIGLNQLREDGCEVLYTSVYGASTRTDAGVELVLERGTNETWLPLRVGRQYAARIREVRKTGNTELTTGLNGRGRGDWRRSGAGAERQTDGVERFHQNAASAHSSGME